ncbi:MAG: gamma carbonic anhydrase family protein [Clostridia bacterium]|nr:gamma carbonic anhydrase family protein [Clostridia bacterium]
MAYIKGNVEIGRDVFIAHDADILGDVKVGNDSSIWYHAVLRGDTDKITVGDRTNIQDNAVVHVDYGFPAVIGDDVTIGHNATIHGCEIGSNTVIGMGCTIMNGAKVGSNCIIGACSLITQGKVIPDNSLVMGAPGKVVRELTKEEIEVNRLTALEYIKDKNIHMNL